VSWQFLLVLGVSPWVAVFLLVRVVHGEGGFVKTAVKSMGEASERQNVGPAIIVRANLEECVPRLGDNGVKVTSSGCFIASALSLHFRVD
jgi:hypothetical protein